MQIPRCHTRDFVIIFIMDSKNLGHILFAIALFFMFTTFFIYVGFYRVASYLIHDSVQKTMLWSNLMDRQIETKPQK